MPYLGLREGVIKNTIESLTAVIPTLGLPPPNNFDKYQVTCEIFRAEMQKDNFLHKQGLSQNYFTRKSA